jgi:radical SAM protein with 4Fe4S-binding SPASM domain
VYDQFQKELLQPFLEKHVIPYVDEHYWMPFYSMGGTHPTVDGFDAKGRAVQFTPVKGNPGAIYSDPIDPVPCWSLFTAAHVLSDGRMTACCSDATGDFVVGDLNKQSFMEAWNSEEFKQLRRAHLSGNVKGIKCEGCVG